jgi:hypothetical protein
MNENAQIALDIIEKPAEQKIAAIPKRWTAERTIA